MAVGPRRRDQGRADGAAAARLVLDDDLLLEDRLDDLRELPREHVRAAARAARARSR